MSNRWMIVVGIEKCLQPAWPTTTFAETDAQALAETWSRAGYASDHIIRLTGPHATCAAIQARIKILVKSLPRKSTISCFWSGPCILHKETVHLVCWDTLPDAVADTSLTLDELANSLSTRRQEFTAFFFSLTPSGDPDPDLFEVKLDELFDGSRPCAAMLGNKLDEERAVDASSRQSLWAQLLIRGTTVLGQRGDLTAGQLYQFVKSEMPRSLRKHYEPGFMQSPQFFGDRDSEVVLAEAAANSAEPTALLDPARLQRVIFRQESRVRVKDLPRFRKSYRLPESNSSAARRFVQRLTSPAVREELQKRSAQLTAMRVYARKDLVLSEVPDGVGQLRTPDFEYSISATLDSEDVTRVVWRHEVGSFADPQFVLNDFPRIFGAEFDQLVFEFRKPIKLGTFIDQLEDSPVAGVKLGVAQDLSSCEISLAGYKGTIVVRPQEVIIHGRSAAGLIDALMQFLARFSTLGELPALRARQED